MNLIEKQINIFFFLFIFLLLLFLFLFQNLSAVTTPKIDIRYIFPMAIWWSLWFASFIFRKWSASVYLVGNIWRLFRYRMDWWNIQNTRNGSRCKRRSCIHWEICNGFANISKAKILNDSLPLCNNGGLSLVATVYACNSTR